MGMVWMVASGKGGAGKSTFTSGLAVSLARHRRLTCVVDADVGLKGIDLMLNLHDKVVFDLFDVMAGDCTLQQALVPYRGLGELFLLSTSQTERPDALDAERFSAVIGTLRRRFDFVLIDCPAGIGEIVMACAACADACVLVVTPDDMSMRDGERIASLLRLNYAELPLHLAVNRADRELIAEGLMMQPRQVADWMGIPLLGELPREERVYRALLRHRPSCECGSRAVALALERMALRMEGGEAPYQTYKQRRKPWRCKDET